jgi:hypothetical protein
MKKSSLLMLAVLIGCTDRLPPAEALAACAPPYTAIDTVAIVACLTDQHGWSADTAATVARNLHDTEARLKQQRWDDSVAASVAEAALTRVNDAADEAKTGPAAVDNVGLAMIWVGSKRSRLYYRGHCSAARAIRDADREQFSNDKMAEREGYRRSTAPADSACYTAPGL